MKIKIFDVKDGRSALEHNMNEWLRLNLIDIQHVEIKFPKDTGVENMIIITYEKIDRRPSI